MAGLPEDEKVKMLGNMPAKERGIVLVRDCSITFLGTLENPGLLVNSSQIPDMGQIPELSIEVFFWNLAPA